MVEERKIRFVNASKHDDFMLAYNKFALNENDKLYDREYIFRLIN
jgi:hypothetical protein